MKSLALIFLVLLLFSCGTTYTQRSGVTMSEYDAEELDLKAKALYRKKYSKWSCDRIMKRIDQLSTSTSTKELSFHGALHYQAARMAEDTCEEKDKRIPASINNNININNNIGR